MLTALYAICALCGWSALGRLAYTSRARLTPPRMALLTAFALMAVGMSIWALSLASGVRSVRAEESVRLCAHLCVMGIVATVSLGLLHLTHPEDVARPRNCWRIVAAATAAALLIVLYGCTLDLHPPVRLNVEDAGHIEIAAYLVVYLGTVAVYATDITRWLWRLAARTARPWLNHGLRIAAAGVAVGIPYSASKAGYAVGFWLHLDPPGEHITTGLLLTLSSLLFAVGMTMPAWGPAVDVARQWPRQLRRYRQLGPLWSDLTGAVPGLVLEGAHQNRRFPLRGLGFALHRRVVEISDARLALRAYTDASVAVQARRRGREQGLGGRNLDTYVEVARILAGVVALRAGQPAEQPDDEAPFDPPGDYDHQVGWLAELSAAYHRRHLPTADTGADGQANQTAL